MPPFAAQPADASLQLVAGTGAQHQAAEQIEVTAFFGGVQQLGLQGLQTSIQAQHPLAFGRQTRTATPTSARAALHQGLGGQVVELIDGVPGSFVADAGRLGSASDRTLFGNMLQQGDALRTTGDVLGEQGR